jgi:hypothetical protein
MELIKLIALNVGVVALVAYITHIAVKSVKHKDKHNN